MTTFPGARWWKVDFHTHTPSSSDYGKGPDHAALRGLSPTEWLLGFMRAEIEAVAVTDHNSGEWIDRLKQALDALARDQPDGFRPLVLFPGVEITANGSAHILAIFPPEATTAHVTRLLGAVGAASEPGESDRAATKSPIEVVRAIVAAGALPVLAHVDSELNSAFGVPGNTLGPLLDEPDLHAMEVIHHAWIPPALYQERKRAWSRVLGSDSHHPTSGPGQRGPGSHYTWVKMETPTHDGLRLALLDGDDVSIRRSDVVSEDQNQHSHLVIERVTVADAQYCGRGAPLVAPLSPWLTTVIGGRGTGKSTIVQMLRLALRREDDLPDALKDDFAAFRIVPAGRGSMGALTAATTVEVILRMDGQRYRVQWSTSGSVPAIEADQGGAWVASPGDIRSRFPARIFSQGQIFAMARDGRALLKIIDEAPEVGRAAWKIDWDRETHRFLSLRAKVRELEKQLAGRSALEGTLDDIHRKLAVFEQASHADVLKAYQRSQRQQRELETWAAGLAEHETVLRTTAERLKPVEIDPSSFDPTVAEERALLDQVTATRAAVQALAGRASALADEARDGAAAWNAMMSASAWSATAVATGDRYRALVAELAARGVTDVSQYGPLVQQRHALNERLRALGELVVTVAGIRDEAEAALRNLTTLRKTLTALREKFLADVLHDNPHVRMTIDAYGRAPRAAEVTLRAILGLKDDRKFADELLSEDARLGCLAAVYVDLPIDRTQREAALETRIAACKASLTAIAMGADGDGQGAWFKKHLRQLSPETLDRFQFWFPPDELAVTYSPRGDARGFRALEQGSPGQKTAAILAFLLAHGTEPIVLDQPEDDLDNELIYELIVAQLRANKRRRQVIVVTHNPNIVVNGDSELILVLESSGGQCKLNDQGSLQSRPIRAQVCKIMEGGREALEKRYRRILAGDGHV